MLTIVNTVRLSGPDRKTSPKFRMVIRFWVAIDFV